MISNDLDIQGYNDILEEKVLEVVIGLNHEKKAKIILSGNEELVEWIINQIQIGIDKPNVHGNLKIKTVN